MISFPFFNQLNTSYNRKFITKPRLQQESKPIRSHNISEMSLSKNDFPYRSSSITHKNPLKTRESPVSDPRRLTTFSFDRQSHLSSLEKFPTSKNLMIFPMSLKTLLQHFPEYLTEYEKEEVKAYHVIYFFGHNCLNKPKTLQEFVDEHGHYIAKQGDHIVYRYEVFNTLGKGTFGNTFKCFDHKQKNFCAVKIIRNKKRLQVQSEKEVKILKRIKELNADKKFGVVQILDHFRFRKHSCIVFELLDMSLLQHLKLNNRRSFPLEVCKSLTKCLLQSLDFLSTAHIIHCDIKPANLVFSSDLNIPLKLIDFGTSCFYGDLKSTYIQSRYYRAPEAIMKLSLTQAIDMWSLGCVLYELITGAILFQGKNENEVLRLIVKYRGKPPQEMIQSSSKADFPWGEKQAEFEFADKGLVNLVESNFYVGCLDWDPHSRLTPAEGLVHCWLK